MEPFFACFAKYPPLPLNFSSGGYCLTDKSLAVSRLSCSSTSLSCAWFSFLFPLREGMRTEVADVPEVDVFDAAAEEMVLCALRTEVADVPEVDVFDAAAEEMVLCALRTEVADVDVLDVLTEEVVVGAMEVDVAVVDLLDAAAEDKIDVGVVSSLRSVLCRFPLPLLEGPADDELIPGAVDDELSKVDVPDAVAEEKVIPGDVQFDVATVDAFETGGEEEVDVRVVEVFNGAPAGVATVDVVAVVEFDVAFEDESDPVGTVDIDSVNADVAADVEVEVTNDTSVDMVPITAGDVVVVAVESEVVAGVVVVVALVVDDMELEVAGCDEAGLLSRKIISSFNEIIFRKLPTP